VAAPDLIIAAARHHLAVEPRPGELATENGHDAAHPLRGRAHINRWADLGAELGDEAQPGGCDLAHGTVSSAIARFRSCRRQAYNSLRVMANRRGEVPSGGSEATNKPAVSRRSGRQPVAAASAESRARKAGKGRDHADAAQGGRGCGNQAGDQKT